MLLINVTDLLKMHNKITTKDNKEIRNFREQN